jgi:3-phosphoglycerate kinase
MPPLRDKTKEERLKEGMLVLNRLKEVGIPMINDGFIEVKNAISQWVQDGQAIILENINFFPFDRIGKLTLFRVAGPKTEPILFLKRIEA